MRKQTKKRKNKLIIIIITTIVLILGAMCTAYILHKNKQKELEQEKINLIKSYYFDSVVTNKKADLFILENNEYIKSGEIAEDIYLKLNQDKSKYKEGYFKVDNFQKEYYIYYKDVEKAETEKEYDERYIKYIPFNKNIITNEKFTLYDNNNEIKYTLSHSEEFTIIVNKKDNYGIIFENQLLYIKDEDIQSIVDASNTKLTNTKGIAVLNYHAVYKPNVNTCNTIICHSESQFESHLKYIKDNNVFTPTLKELEMYLDGYIQLPKSVVITLDDGWLSKLAVELLNKYELNGTVFLVTSWYDAKTVESKYVEAHSHTHNMHNQGDCPGGQGGGIKCLSEKYIQEDLKKSREKLNNTTYFCYPFYEYNNYSINQLKKAGFTMAFGGYNENGQLKAKPGIDKFRIPRYVIYSYTTVNEIKNYIG